MAMQLCSYVAMWLCGCVAMWPHGQQITKIPVHVFRKILIPYSRFSRFVWTDLHDFPVSAFPNMFQHVHVLKEFNFPVQHFKVSKFQKIQISNSHSLYNFTIFKNHKFEFKQIKNGTHYFQHLQDSRSSDLQEYVFLRGDLLNFQTYFYNKYGVQGPTFGRNHEFPKNVKRNIGNHF